MFVMIELIFFPFLKDGTTALLKAAIKGYNNVIEELLKFSPTLGLLKVSSETYGIFDKYKKSKSQMEVLMFLIMQVEDDKDLELRKSKEKWNELV